MDQADQQSNVPHVEAVVLGPPNSGKAHLLGRLLIDCGAFDRRVIERFMAQTSDLYNSMVPARRRLEGLIRTRSELERGITLATRRFKLRTKRYPLSLANVPSLGFFERSCITGAANADLALMVVSAAAAEFEACMADRKAKSLFEVALVAKGCGIEQLVVVLTKADEVMKELKPGQGVREYQALIEDRERRVVALLLSMQFKKENLQVVIVSVWEEQGVLTPLFANGLSLLDALENIRWSELPMARTRRQQGPSAPFRLVVLGADRIGGIGTVVSGRLVSGRWDTPNHSGFV